jgi:hypothetical protein
MSTKGLDSEGVSRVVDRLAGDDRALFLATLAWELTLAGRTLYPPPSTPEYEAARHQISINELLHRTAEQLQATLGNGSWSAPNDQLIDYLIDHSRRWDQATTLLYALERTLAALERRNAEASVSGEVATAEMADEG